MLLKKCLPQNTKLDWLWSMKCFTAVLRVECVGLIYSPSEQPCHFCKRTVYSNKVPMMISKGTISRTM